MGITELDMLCYRNAQRGPYLYQAEEGGRIKIMFTKEESHEGHKSHHHAHSNGEGIDESTHHEHLEDVEPGGSHGHETHGDTHGGSAHAVSDETAGQHSHEKGARTADHDQSEHNPA